MKDTAAWKMRRMPQEELEALQQNAQMTSNPAGHQSIGVGHGASITHGTHKTSTGTAHAHPANRQTSNEDSEMAARIRQRKVRTIITYCSYILTDFIFRSMHHLNQERFYTLYIYAVVN